MTDQTQIAQELLSLRVGDKVRVEAMGLRKARVLTVTAAKEALGDGLVVCVTSGRVRPGHRGGGALCLKILTDEISDGIEVTYQPTLPQPVRVVTGLTCVERAPQQEWAALVH